MIRALFYRGRHHLRAPLLARPFDERPRVTVAAIAERIRREARARAYRSSAYISILPDVEKFAPRLANLIALRAEGLAGSLPEHLVPVAK